MASSEPLLDQKHPASSVSSHPIDFLLGCCLPLLCLGLICTASFKALRNAREDPWTAVFAVASGAILLLLWSCFRQFEKLPSGPSPAKDRLKLLIWTLCVLLNAIFSLRVTLILGSFVMSCFVWGVAVLTTLLGVHLLFFSTPAVVSTPPIATDASLPPVPAEQV